MRNSVHHGSISKSAIAFAASKNKVKGLKEDPIKEIRLWNY